MVFVARRRFVYFRNFVARLKVKLAPLIDCSNLSEVVPDSLMAGCFLGFYGICVDEHETLVRRCQISLFWIAGVDFGA